MRKWSERVLRGAIAVGMAAMSLWSSAGGRPVQAAPAKPTGNAFLSSLVSSDGYIGFQWYASSFSSYVANNVSSIVLTPTLQDNTGSYAFTSSPNTCSPASGAPATCALDEGMNVITVTVTAADNTKKTYVVNMRRDAEPDPHRANVSALGHGPISDHYCVVLEDGQLLCWGYNSNGQIGDGTTTNQLKPYTVPNVSDAVQVGMGTKFTCILRRTSTVQCWGDGKASQLGNGDIVDSSVPTDVLDVAGGAPMANVAMLAVGLEHACAVVPGGYVRCWGVNSNNELADGTIDDRSTPVTVTNLSGATQVVAGGGYSCALVVDGTVHCWGDNYYVGAGLGSGATSTPLTVVMSIGGAPLTDVVAIRSGGGNTCARTSIGWQYCWGGNNSSYPWAGNGTNDEQILPVRAQRVEDQTELTGVAQVTGGAYHSCFRMEDGTVRCAGASYDGQIGDGTLNDEITRTVPVEIAPGVPMTDVIDIAGGEDMNCAMRGNGDVWCWGGGDSGQIGDGAGIDRLRPVLVIQAVPSDDANLIDLTLDPGVLAPAFVSTTTSYTAEVPNGTTSVAVTATTSDVSATIAYASTAGACTGSACPITASGTTTITITITAADLTTTEVYTIVVTVADQVLSNDASLDGLEINPGVLSPVFVSTTTDYTATVPNGTTSVAVTATTSDVSATIAYASTAGACTGSACPITASGTTTITITITAPDLTTTEVYTIEVTVADQVLSNNAALGGLEINPGTLSPVFVSTTTSYTAEVPNGTTSVAVTATTSDVSATIVYASTAGSCTPGNASPSDCAIASSGATTITVTAADGATLETYTIVVTVADPTEPTDLTTIDRVWPGTGLAAGGMPVQIFGSGFAAALTVTVDGASVPFTIASDGRIDFVMPPGTAGESVDVVVATANGSVTAVDAFTYVAPEVIEFDGEVGGVFTTTDGVVVTIPPQGVSGSFYLTMTPQPPAPGVPGNVLMYAFRLDAVWNGMPLASLTNPVTIQLPIDENIFAIQDGERPWLYQWMGGEERGKRSEEREEEGSALFSLSSPLISPSDGRWVLVRGQQYEPTTRIMTVALRPMGEYALSTAYLRSYWLPVVPTMK
jgi:alpha-tubulin suppressor-like RCC1 family protein